MSFKSVKKAFASLLFAAMFLLPLASVKADIEGPKFNFMENDVKTLRGINATNGEKDWHSPVSGKAGDEFEGIVYIHNGKIDTTAHNTRIRVFIPEHTTDKKATITATISADNAESVTDTMTVNFNEDTDLEFLPGNTHWFPTINGSAKNEVPFPNGQSGNEIVKDGGVNVGNVNGCWEFVQYVTFAFKSKEKKEEEKFPNLALTKTVRNVTENEKDFVKSDEGVANDTLEYMVVVKNTGQADAKNVVVVDEIPAHTTYVAGSTTLQIDSGSVHNVGDTLVGKDGIVIDCLPAGVSAIIKFKVKINCDVHEEECLVNKASAFVDKISASDTAQTCIKKAVTPPVTPPHELPNTGAASTVLISLLTLMAGYGAYVYRMRKIRATVECKVAKDLLSK